MISKYLSVWVEHFWLLLVLELVALRPLQVRDVAEYQLHKKNAGKYNYVVNMWRLGLCIGYSTV